jgi:hypothetical protein
MQVAMQAGQDEAHQKNIVVRVRYIAARKQFVDPKALPAETLADLKPRVLNFYNLVEGGASGGTKTYYFAVDGIAQTNLQETLDSLAKGKHELELDLLERFEQG